MSLTLTFANHSRYFFSIHSSVFTTNSRSFLFYFILLPPPPPHTHTHAHTYSPALFRVFFLFLSISSSFSTTHCHSAIFFTNSLPLSLRFLVYSPLSFLLSGAISTFVFTFPSFIVVSFFHP